MLMLYGDEGSVASRLYHGMIFSEPVNITIASLKSWREEADEGRLLDRINRFKKRGVLRDDVNYGLLKDLRYQIVHEYIIDETDRVLREALSYVALIREMFDKARAYSVSKVFLV